MAATELNTRAGAWPATSQRPTDADRVAWAMSSDGGEQRAGKNERTQIRVRVQEVCVIWMTLVTL
jgi:hypothetical protein